MAESVKIKLELDTSEAEKQIENIIIRARAARELLAVIQKTPVGILSGLCRELMSCLPDAEGRFDFVWNQCSADEQDTVKAVREKAEAILSEHESEV